ncbi:hypothetical protein P280DRAFT_83117 [Massarina eburnea CBS 473.64]|uniref:Uncharacterized protein n=1 Tax=Massarina eburnea CBS 473.64 TaxID=1395130 RepID=A0A6A6RWM2_9PLEO|nr:hypothetical protein P280DRAFT_83117 [Massarina eburnea CBS 473.64]
MLEARRERRLSDSVEVGQPLAGPGEASQAASAPSVHQQTPRARPRWQLRTAMLARAVRMSVLAVLAVMRSVGGIS